MPAPESPAIAIPVAMTPVALRTRLGVILASHLVVDVYAAFVPPLLGVLEIRCRLTAAETAWLLGLGSLASGVSQPLAAWLADRTDSRQFGALGLVFAAVCLSCIGLANDFGTLAGLYALGMIGVGVFHPIGASSMGQLADQIGGGRRSMGVSLFFVAGMIGGVCGSLLAPYVTALPGGFELLRSAMFPGLLLAAVLQLAIGRVPHRPHGHHSPSHAPPDIGHRWRMVGLLYASNVIRFVVNIALLYLLLRWAQAWVARIEPGLSAEDVAMAAAPINGRLAAFVIVGMAIGGLASGSLVRGGREKWPIVLTPILFAPAIALFGKANLTGACVLAVLAGIGFASMIPITISLSQRLLPHRTSLASALMLGGAWSVALVGPALAEFCMHGLGLGLDRSFVVIGSLLVVSGLVCLPLKGSDPFTG